MSGKYYRYLCIFIYILLLVVATIVPFGIQGNLIIYSISYSLLLAFFWKRLKKLKRVICSLEFIYLSVYSVYAVMPSIQYLIDNGKQRLYFFTITNKSILISFKYYLIVFIAVSIILLVMGFPKSQKFEVSLREAIRSSEGKQISRIFDNIALGCLLLILYSFLRNGISFFTLDFVTRRELSDFSFRQYVWLYMMVYTIEIVCECSLKQDALKNRRRLFQLIIIISFFALSLLIDRRHLIPVIIASFIYITLMNKRINIKYILYFFAFVGLMVMYALARNNIAVRGSDIGLLTYEGLSEFILTGYITVYYVSHPINNFYCGRTYLWDTLTRIFPKVIFPWKPKDLGIVFMSEVLENRIGFAFNPIAEGYLNFGTYLVLFVPLIIFIFIRLGYRLTRKEPMFYFVFCSYSLDFCRGQFANCIFDVLLMYIILFSMKKVKRYKNG